ncbi:MAG: hypothetical protein L0Y71_08815 [Gemmataceae bacterium]|nr:hypothetical protein [Gemmataceae bacterium]
MLRRVAACLAVMIVPACACAQAGPERYLPPRTQIYVHWDGFDAHRATYEKSALGQMMKGDTGKFFDAVWDWINDAAEVAGQADPQAPAMIKDGLKSLSGISKHGFALSIEAKGIVPPQAQLTLVFPKAAGKGGVMLPLIRRAADQAGAPVQDTKVGNRTIQHVSVPFVNFGWWNEGDDAVIMIGTDDPVAYARLIDSNETGLAQTPLYRQVTAFKEFPIWARGYVDMASLAKVGGDVSPEVSRLVEDLGLKSLKSITFVSGFDGPAERSVTEIEISGPRKGLLALAGQKKISLARLPAMPDDLTRFTASNFNAGSFYDAGVQVVEAVVRMFAPDVADNIKEGIKQFEGILGVRLGEDLFGSFDDMTVTYSAPSEGLPVLGGVYLLKVKNEKKLRDALDSLIRAIPNIPGANIEMKKRDYHGVEINELHLNNPGNFNVPCFCIHKGWFALANYPQSLYGYILRAKGELPTWKADPKLAKALQAFPSEFTSISVSDPRPTVQFLFSVLPPAITLGNSFTQFAPGLRPFDVGLVPHARSATRHLFPNITVTTDDGKKIRSETRASLALPF